MPPLGWEGIHFRRQAYDAGYEAGLRAPRQLSSEDAAMDALVPEADWDAWLLGYEAAHDRDDDEEAAS